MKNIKVIATYFGPRRRYPYMIDETIELLREVVALEQILDKGACCDTVIVNHDVTPLLKDGQKAINYLNSIDRIATKNGTLKILNRDWNQGIGGSFGSFSYAFGKLKNQYEYWFFTEDNVVQVRENYIRESIDVIKQTNCSFVCGLRCKSLEQTAKRWPMHCHGGCGMIHVSKLSKIYDRDGCLPHCKEAMPKSIQEKIKLNKPYKFNDKAGKQWYEKFQEAEIDFTNIFVKTGGSLVDLNTEPLSRWLGKVY